ncbi:hypothetical protein TNIN_188471 [Trichonephila inaurata madagascariensis]|uniref:Uncharacterized protein n=1 Tax=Trichonephila inaurata madagascariensis TaxID=2747483 RepID=A0A8X6XH60_9ARAC|nr:hypothetical protein TNIN_188471 [Trichonephila inaurata madagascariensis]
MRNPHDQNQRAPNSGGSLDLKTVAGGLKRRGDVTRNRIGPKSPPPKNISGKSGLGGHTAEHWVRRSQSPQESNFGQTVWGSIIWARPEDQQFAFPSRLRRARSNWVLNINIGV